MDDTSEPVISRVTFRDDDATAIMVAGDPLPSGFGVRVVMRVFDKTRGVFALNGLTAHLPNSPYITWLEADDEALAALGNPQRYFTNNRARVARAAGQQENAMAFHEFRLRKEGHSETDPDYSVDIVTYGARVPLREAEHALLDPVSVAVTRISLADRDLTPTRVGEHPLYADANATVPVFEDDPVSDKDVQDPPPYIFGAYRPAGQLDTARDMVNIATPLETNDFLIRHCPEFVGQDVGNNPTDPRDIVLDPGEISDARSNDQSAISAYYGCLKFFKYIGDFGLNTAALFRRVNRPLQVHYRSGIRPGPGKDGRTINARVDIRDFPDAGGLTPTVGSVHMFLALANLNRWFRDVPDTGAFEPREAQPLGIANSRRWIHHELGHVLIAAALGELELRFVHSIGDGLAAVLADPTSRIPEADRDGPWADFRFQTFPWVFTTRRHDRSVLSGWSWSGTMHRDVLRTPESDLRKLKGYNSEQILSTTLFRLYRCLGGDTVRTDGEPDEFARRKASMVVLYLLVRGVDSFAHPPLLAEELECALIEADLALTTLPSTFGDIWTGGQAHKPIRWAFEAQGLHPADPNRVNNGPGAPPPVDLYLKDKRSGIEKTFAGEVDHGDGSYNPVSLHWAADAGWVGELSNGSVVLGNRGTSPVTSVHLRGWIGLHFGGNTILWIHAWSFEYDIATPPAPHETVTYDVPTISLPASWPAMSALLLLEISAPEDRANTDPAIALATEIAQGDQPPKSREAVMHRVANDNNLGLFWL
ncbi:hypothetical protein [Shimia sp.]|uniref:hypothetical protein n=1 Tax=Shimia sp. TaxID=1954381 RepID=UPI003BAA8379